MTLEKEYVIGNTYNEYVVVADAGDRKGNRMVYAVCSCGIKKKVGLGHLKSNHTKSCGCLQKKLRKIAATKHGMSTSKEYLIWNTMKNRCNNPKVEKYKDYGARGIKVCKEWLSFEQFYKDMGAKPEGKSIDRIDNNGDYCKNNCRWATNKEQQRNTRRNRLIKGKTLVEMSETLGINYGTLRSKFMNKNTIIAIVDLATGSVTKLGSGSRIKIIGNTYIEKEGKIA